MAPALKYSKKLTGKLRHLSFQCNNVTTQGYTSILQPVNSAFQLPKTIFAASLHCIYIHIYICIYIYIAQGKAFEKGKRKCNYAD